MYRILKNYDQTINYQSFFNYFYIIYQLVLVIAQIIFIKLDTESECKI